MVLQRDTSTLGTVVGIIVVIVAIAGSVFLDWEWGAPNQPVALVIGVIAAAVAVIVTYRQIRS